MSRTALAIPELIDQIVQQGQRDDCQVLSIVAKRFTIPSQRRLFRTIVVPTDGACERLHALLSSSPHLAAHARHFGVNLSNVKQPEPLVVLDMLQGLKHFTITAYHEDELSWPDIDAGVRSAIYRALQRPGVKSLHLDSIDEIPRALLRYGIHTFSHLTIIGVLTLDENDSEQPDWITARPLTDDDNGPLQKLQMAIVGEAGSFPIYTLLRQPEMRPALRHLPWICIVYDRAGWDFLDDAGLFGNLKEVVLTWVFMGSRDAEALGTQHPFDLPFLPNLRKISLLVVAPLTGMWVDAFDFIGEAVTLSEKTPALEDLRLIIDPSAVVEDEVELVLPPPKPIAFFADPRYAERLPCLRRISCFKTERSTLGLDDFTVYMGAVFPAPLNDGILYCGMHSPASFD
ncbi:hypothetical protein FB45DRAFT_524533 [Roridomyces roridus]|uniref:Uncharacterized protein n=1 Tax=Roridomyces roridus TaxID=1738132 RepID=A0AAD7FNB5_9AGAR|nr:hypothetical protein FB45DRAFT_524533 [Roridomyces roridus]